MPSNYVTTYGNMGHDTRFGPKKNCPKEIVRIKNELRNQIQNFVKS